MAGTSVIEWTDKTWNPVRGCTRVSPGCGGPGPHGGCYAEGIAARFSGPGQAYEGLAEMRGGKPRWTGKLTFGHDFDAPLRWRKPARIFVNSMSDLFHEGLSDEEIATVYAVCVAAHHLRGHTSQILTKRSDRMRRTLTSEPFWDQVNAEAGMHVMEGVDALARRSDDARATLDDYGPDNPPPGVWLGVSAEDQRRADERVPDLLAAPAAIRFVSAEPLLGPIDFWLYLDPKKLFRRRLDWIIVGGESGLRARPMHPDWARAIRDACAAAGVPFFFKQWSAWKPCSTNNGEWPTAAPGFIRLRPDGTVGPDGWPMQFVGKKAAGRLLDGVTHDAMPEVAR